MDNQTLNFFDQQEDIKKALDAKDVLLFLDYDGTLTPIVDTPDLAVISDDMRATVSRAAEVMSVSIVSGRATDDVRGKVGLEQVFYAGSHGFEIIDPEGKVTINEEARQIRPVIDEVHAQLSQRLSKIQGALVEHVKYTISAHYRLVADKDFPAVEKAVDEILMEFPTLRKTSGKKVFEIRPKIDWDKGRAVQWILKFLKFDPQKQVPIYIGDDTTDEDAFKVLSGKGLGILVAEKPRPTTAAYMIPDTAAVKAVLEWLISDKQK